MKIFHFLQGLVFLVSECHFFLILCEIRLFEKMLLSQLCGVPAAFFWGFFSGVLGFFLKENNTVSFY